MHIDHHTHLTHTTTQCAQNTRMKWINGSASVEVFFHIALFRHADNVTSIKLMY